VDVLGVVRREIESGQLLDAGTGLVVGVSGGSDSLCLLHILMRLRREFDLSLHVAHLNHCLRGEEADEDMIFVALLTMAWGLPCIIEVSDVASVAQRRHMSLEEAARNVRYGFLMNVAHRVGAAAVAVGHHADDQSETVLMHFLRGAGIGGLKGMLPCIEMSDVRVLDSNRPHLASRSATRLVRPLLTVPRAAIEQYCQDHDLKPRFDRSNLDTTIFRNRLRHELLPLLETYNPNIRALLQRTAAVVAADHQLITSLLNDAWAETVIEENDHGIAFDLGAWRALPLALQRATVREAAFRQRPQIRDVDFVHVEHALEVGNKGSTGARAILPQGLVMSVGYDALRLSDCKQEPPIPNWPLLWCDDPVPVTLSGNTFLPDRLEKAPVGDETKAIAGGEDKRTKWSLEALQWQGEPSSAFNNTDRWTAYLDADRLRSHLVLRRRLPGDRFQPLGMGGRSVQISDFMINAKVPQHLRERIPLLVQEQSSSPREAEIAWLVGWRIDERVKVTKKTRNVVRLRWHRCPILEAPEA